MERLSTEQIYFGQSNFISNFRKKEKVVSLSRQLSWSHILALLPIKDPLEREFYATLCVNEGWSVRVLRERKNSMLYERTAISKKPEETLKNDLLVVQEKGEISVDVVFRDPYILSFARQTMNRIRENKKTRL